VRSSTLAAILVLPLAHSEDIKDRLTILSLATFSLVFADRFSKNYPNFGVNSAQADTCCVSSDRLICYWEMGATGEP
jgi:hypothetical protein